MRFFIRVLFGIIIFSLLILILVPPIIGWRLEKQTDVTFLTNVNHSNIETVSYKRGWFSSDVIFKLKLNDPAIQHILENLTVNSTQITSNLEIWVQGHIQHGPIFYYPVKQMPLMGIALMTRKIILTPQQQNFFKKMGFDSALQGVNSTYLSFTGKYWDYINLQNIRMLSSDGILIQLKDINTRVQLSTQEQRLRGHIRLVDFSVGDDNTFLMLPQGSLIFDMVKDKYGLWIGSQTLSLSQIEMRDGDQLLRLSNIKLDGAIQEQKGLLSANRNFNIQKLTFNEQTLGPIQFQLSVKNLNAKAINTLIETYQDVLQHGEMYEYQLKQRLFSIIPSAVRPGSTIQIDKMNVVTPDGQLQMTAKVFWPTENFVQPENMMDFMQMLKMNVDFRISIPLANKLMRLLGQMTYPYQLTTSERQELLDREEVLRMNTQINAYVILDLIGARAIPKEDGIDLLTKIRNNISLPDYIEEIKKLLFIRKIDLATSHELNFLYTMLWQQVEELERQILVYQQTTEKRIHNQLNQYIQAGLIIQEKNDYKFSLVRDKGKMAINGHHQ